MSQQRELSFKRNLHDLAAVMFVGSVLLSVATGNENIGNDAGM